MDSHFRPVPLYNGDVEHPLNLPDEPDQLKQVVGTLASEVKSQALLVEKLKHQLTGMRRHRFGASSEAIDQLQLILEDEEVPQAAESAATMAANSKPLANMYRDALSSTGSPAHAWPVPVVRVFNKH